MNPRTLHSSEERGPSGERGGSKTAAVALAIFAAMFLLFAPGRALAKYEPPKLERAVVDQANALDDAREAKLVAHLDALREEKGFAIVVFLPASLGELTVQDVAYDTFNAWGVGSKEKDDGVLLVVAPNDRQLWIETGKGVGDRITDVQAGRIYRDVMTPRLKAGDTAGAVEEGVLSIERALTGQDPVVAPPPKARPRTEKRAVQLTTTQKWAIGGVVALVILLAIVSRTFRRVLFSILEILIWAALLGRGGRGSGGGGGDGGGYGGGGGRSGGGGAGGGW
jgi:uncharacterized protein